MPSHEHPSVGLSLTFISGMINTATYINYQAFATAQTGNLILALSQLYHQQWDSAGKKISFSSFFLSRHSFSFVDKGLLSKKEPFIPLAFVLIIWASIFIYSFLFARSTAPPRPHRDTYFFRFSYSVGIL
ncbi:DUF1275 family protein [Listeria booriae]|uniref:DUF1275 family protein n=1 Tax=Listeria booriae TaxID=1552123 RepID=UPI001C8A5479|nr:DUF1275 family protein [Listeria booriae]